jgi:hypothetical protein
MGTINLDGWEKGVYRVRNRVYDGVEATAMQVHRDAVAKAPVRKAFQGGNKLPRKGDLADFSMKIRGGHFTGGEIQEAAALMGINLSESQSRSIAAGRGNLQAQQNTRRSLGANHLSWTNRPGRGGMTSEQARAVKPRRNVAGTRLPGFTPVRTVGRPGAAKFSARARYDLRTSTTGQRGGNPSLKHANRNRGRGVIAQGGGQYRYGGFLKKHIVVDTPTGEGDLRIVFTVRSKAPYSRYVEFPTSRTAAQPYLLPAFKAARNKLAANIKRIQG